MQIPAAALLEGAEPGGGGAVGAEGARNGSASIDPAAGGGGARGPCDTFTKSPRSACRRARPPALLHFPRVRSERKRRAAGVWRSADPLCAASGRAAGGCGDAAPMVNLAPAERGGGRARCVLRDE